jgi:cell division protein FtsL
MTRNTRRRERPGRTTRRGGKGPRRRASARPKLRLVPKRSRRGRRVPFLIVSAALVGPLVFGVVTLQAVISQSSFRMQSIARQNQQLQQSYGELKLQIARLSSPDRIVQQARRLGLSLPDPNEVHSLAVPGVAGWSDGATEPVSFSFSMKRLLGDQP